MVNHSSPVTSGSAHSDLSGSAVLSEEIYSGEEQAIYTGKKNKSYASAAFGLIKHLIVSCNYAPEYILM